MSNQEYLLHITKAVKERFAQARSILSFSEYLDSLHQNAQLYCRNAPQYILGAFDHFGHREIGLPGKTVRRFRIFDGLEENDQTNPTWVAGQEEVQNAIYRMLGNFVQEGRVTRLVLLHGPNGSGKTSIINAIIRALELYSSTPDGALYRFNWVFPSEKKIKGGGIGFSSSDSGAKDLDSYAHLDGDQIDARIVSPLKDHPLLLLPYIERHALFERLYSEELLPRSFKISTYLQKGDLSPRNRLIFDTLLAHYGGNYAEVLRHIQIERFYISHRYNRSASTVEPQMHVDAGVRQVTADHSLSALPRPLNNLSLFQPVGPLVDANRGIIEYSDLLKRPVEAFKYLLGTCETGHVNIDTIILYLDLFLIGNANEQNLDQFKEIAEFTSFKSRIELMRVPYLLRYSIEKKIYDTQLASSNLPKPVTPHLTELAALWAILTRIKKPNPKRLPEQISALLDTFTPLEKARLYNNGETPIRYSADQAKQIRQHIDQIVAESRNDIHYEGRIGASPREIRTLLLHAAHNDKYKSLSPLALFEELEQLVQDRSVYRFLQLEPRDGYYDPKQFIDVIRDVHMDIIDKEFQTATGLVQHDQYQKLLTRYIQHVKADIQKEKVHNPITQKSESPDENLMQTVEEVLLSEGESPKQFRQELIGKIAAYKLDNPSLELDIPTLFADSINKLEKNFFSKQYKRLQRIARNCLILLVDTKHGLNENDLKEASETIENLKNEYGYHPTDIREHLALLSSNRYGQTPEETEE